VGVHTPPVGPPAGPAQTAGRAEDPFTQSWPLTPVLVDHLDGQVLLRVPQESNPVERTNESEAEKETHYLSLSGPVKRKSR
jgi:hypothetical protein